MSLLVRSLYPYMIWKSTCRSKVLVTDVVPGKLYSSIQLFRAEQ